MRSLVVWPATRIKKCLAIRQPTMQDGWDGWDGSTCVWQTVRCALFSSINGTRAGEPFVKHLEGEIWELRPLRDRILFAGWVDGQFVLLHHFVKKTQKTPKREIEQAKRNLADFIERNGNNE